MSFTWHRDGLAKLVKQVVVTGGLNIPWVIRAFVVELHSGHEEIVVMEIGWNSVAGRR